MVTTLFGNNLRSVILLLMVGVFVSMAGAFAAPPVNDACDNALLVTPGVAISGQTLNTEATFAPDDPELSCTMGPGFGSVFFEFVATETSARVRTDVDSVDLDSDFAVYAVDQNNPCDKSLWTEVGCSEDGEFEFNGDICIEGLTVTHIYKIMLVSFTEGSSGDYTLQIDSPCQGQASGDADGDGVPDNVDICPDLSAGDDPDLNRPGCPNNQSPVAVCQDVTVSADANCSADASIDNGSYDPDEDEITLTQDPAGPYVLGTTTVTLTVSDGQFSDTCTATVTVVDVTPPTVTASASPNYLWPANHKMHEIVWSGTATDNCDGSPSALEICGVTSNEDDNIWDPKAGDGNTNNDIQIIDGILYLRAERSGKSDGRVYTIKVTSTDASGNTGSTTFTVEVPHDSSSHSCDDPNCDLNASPE